MPTIYSAGYQMLDRDRFAQFVQDQGALVADVRLKPVSRNHIWNKNALAGLLGARYTWIEALGNLNYKGGPIVLKDPVRGLEALACLLQSPAPVIALCVCADYRICHRSTVIGQLLTAIPDLDVIHLTATLMAKPISRQPSLLG